jgi:hypothetical protein
LTEKIYQSLNVPKQELKDFKYAGMMQRRTTPASETAALSLVRQTSALPDADVLTRF